MSEREARDEILIVEDDPATVSMVLAGLKSPGRVLRGAASAEEAQLVLRDFHPGVLIVDLGLPGVSGLELVRTLKEEDPTRVLLVVTGQIDEQAVVRAMSWGASDYLAKPFDLADLRAAVDAAVLRGKELQREAGRRPAAKPDRQPLEGVMAGRSPVMIRLFKEIGRLAASNVPVLIRGESGTGKELAARALHRYGPGEQAPFVAVDCAGLPAALLESELFGYERGAFTGAVASKPGRFELADGGSLFLDEVSHLSLELQAKLLRALQEQKSQRLGGTRPVAWRVRLLAATNDDLADLVRRKQFRQDLYFRLAGAELLLPPLRERLDDLPWLVERLLAHTRRAGRPVRVTQQGLDRLAAFDWPGNIRQLEHVLHRAVAAADGPVLGPRELNVTPTRSPAAAEHQLAIRTPEDIRPMAQTKQWYARACVEACGGNRREAARRMGVHVKTLHALLRGEEAA